MKYILLIISLASILMLSSCGMLGGTIDFGFLKIPTILIFAVIIIYAIHRRNSR